MPFDPLSYAIGLTNGEGGGSGTSDYGDLSNKPKINNVTLSGNKTSSQLSLAAASDITNLQSQIDAITAASDVVDVVGTYAELQAYDTSTLHENDIVKVLDDSTHSDAIAYYRWVDDDGTMEWSYIGSQGPFYTKSETDAALAEKYEKPDDGIPKSDLASAVQTSLGKADTALQSSDISNKENKGTANIYDDSLSVMDEYVLVWTTVDAGEEGTLKFVIEE